MGGIPSVTMGQSMPTGWLKKITWCEEHIKILEKKMAELEKKNAELEKVANATVYTVSRDAVMNLGNGNDRPPGQVAPISEPPLKRGPGRPRKTP